MKQIFAGLVIFAVCSIIILIAGTTVGPTARHTPAANAANQVAMQLALDRYAALTKNMTQRIQVAEQALLKLQQRKASRQTVSAPAPASAEGKGEGLEGSDDHKDSSGGGGGGAGGDAGDEPEETEDERKQRLEQELKEQHSLIGYDPVTKKFKQRWRSDFKCGDRVPLLPDEETVECDPASEATCCSALGWCGKSVQHCTCDTCVDYSSKVKLRLDGIELFSKAHECEESAFGFGDIKTPEACAKLVVKQAECGRLLMFSHTYPSWGCRCCTGGTGANDEDKPDWSLYKLKVTVLPKDILDP